MMSVGQMGDLIEALEEASTSHATMDLSPCKRKVRKKRAPAGSSEAKKAHVFLLPSQKIHAKEGSNYSAFNASESSLDEPQQAHGDQMEVANVLTEPELLLTAVRASRSEAASSSASRHAMSKLPTATVPLNVPLALSLGVTAHHAAQFQVESDSFTETTFTPARQHRRKRLIKKMAVEQNGVSPTENWDFKNRFKSESGSGMEFDYVGNTSSIRPVIANFRVLRNGKVHRTGSHGSFEPMDSSMPDLPSYLSDDASSIASSSCSDSDAANARGAGGDGDDEQSDWVIDSASKRREPNDEYMGIPSVSWNVLSSLFRRHFPPANGTAPDSNLPENKVPDSSDTDISQSSLTRSWRLSSRASLAKRAAAKTTRCGFLTSLQKRIPRFLDDSSQDTLELGHLKRHEKKEVLKLASCYKLDVKYESRKFKRCVSLVKKRQHRQFI